jgi:PAS domain S-box-containing protein
VKRRQIFRAQIIAMIIALSLPWLSNMDYILHGAQEYDFTPIAFIFSGAILFWAMSAVKLFSIVPIARDLVFELMDDSIFVLDEQNRIIDANASAKKFISEDKFLGKSIDELSGKFPEKLSEILNTPDQQIEIPYGEKTYAVQVTVLQTGDEVKNGAILSLRDITSRKVAELSLRNTEASLRKSESELLELNASKDKFFSIIAHDLKSPFTGIIGLIEILVSDSETFSPEERKRWLADLLKLSLNTLKLLENLLQWSQIQIGSVKPDRHLHNLNELLQSCLYAVKQPAEVKKIAFRDAIPPDMVIFTDANIMSLVIRNLLNNAIKFSYPEGDVTISARKIAGSFEIIVEDNGTGISPGMLQNLFRIDKAVSKHGTAGEKGTGLGLILCREFVNKLQGTLDVESIEGQGSKFIITLPDEAGAEEKD